MENAQKGRDISRTVSNTSPPEHRPAANWARLSNTAFKDNHPPYQPLSACSHRQGATQPQGRSGYTLPESDDTRRNRALLRNWSLLKGAVSSCVRRQDSTVCKCATSTTPGKTFAQRTAVNQYVVFLPGAVPSIFAAHKTMQ